MMFIDKGIKFLFVLFTIINLKKGANHVRTKRRNYHTGD